MIKISIDPQVMQSVISGVADHLKSKIDLNQVKKLCKKRYGIETINGVEYKGGNMVLFDGQIACKLNFEARFPLSVLISTKENIDSTPPEKNDIREEINSIPDVVDDIRKEIEDVPKDELYDIPEESVDLDKSKKLRLINKDDEKKS